MAKNILILVFLVMILAVGGCIKESYDMSMFSEKAHLSPVLAIAAVKGDISLSDLVEPGDTLVFDENNLVKFIFREDSVIDLKLEDFYYFDEMFTFSETYTIGEISLSSFRRDLTYTLDQISTSFNPALRSEFVALNGTTNPFPAFPLTDLGETDVPVLTNLEYATFSEGFIDVTVTNNLTAPLSDIRIELFNSAGHTPVGDEVIITALDAGESGIASIDVSNLILTNSLVAAVVLTGSPGTGNPVLIDLSNSNIGVEITGRDLKVISGRVVVPEQQLPSEDRKKSVSVNPGRDIELVEFRTLSGSLDYTAQTFTPLSTSVSLLFPTAVRSGSPLTEEVRVDPFSTVIGLISLINTYVDLSSDETHPYNIIPVNHEAIVSSNGTMVDFDSEDVYSVDIELTDPTIDFVKGYFGQVIHMGDPDTIELGINEITDRVSGNFYLSNPSIRLNYSNSFGIPVTMSLEAEGRKDQEIILLGLAPFDITYPIGPVDRDATDVYLVDRTNSSLPALISLPPDEIRFTGSAKMNSQGNTGSRDNYLYEDSRIIGSLDIEIPMEGRISNLQFADTVDNFLRTEDPEDDNLFRTEDFDLLRIDLTAKNGFPLGVSVTMHLYDSISSTVKNTITANNLLEAAPVDASGKVTGPAGTFTSIELTRDFFSSVSEADKIIFRFTLVSTSGGTKDVKIYSDYRIDFKAALVVKPDIKLNYK